MNDPVPEIPQAGGDAQAPSRPPGLGTLLIALAVIWVWEVAIQLAIFRPDLQEPGQEGFKPKLPGGYGALALTVLGWGFALAVAWWVACRRRGAEEGLALSRVSLRTTVWAALIGLAGGAIAFTVLVSFPATETPMDEMAASPGGLTAIAVLTLAVPICEELYYRGFVFSILARGLGTGVAFGIVAVWFGALHVLQYWGSWPTIAIVAAMGVVWTVMRVRTGSVVPSLVSHWVYNVTTIAIGIAWALAR